MVNPISVEVIAPVLTDLRHRTHLTGGGKWCIIGLKPGPVKQGGDDD